MRLATCAVFGAVLTMFSTGNLRAEEPAWWWPFGSDDASAHESASGARHSPSPSVAPESDSWFSWSGLSDWSWPELPFGNDEPATDTNSERRRRRYGVGKAAQMHRNRWAQNRSQTATPTDDASPWEMMTESARRVGESTRNAWHKTVDLVTPGDESDEAPVIRQAARDSWWDRLRGNSSPQTQGPQTVTEWMAQERLDP